MTIPTRPLSPEEKDYMVRLATHRYAQLLETIRVADTHDNDELRLSYTFTGSIGALKLRMDRPVEWDPTLIKETVGDDLRSM